MILTNVAIKNRVTVLVLVILIVVLGIVSYVKLPREAAPDVPIPIVNITTTYNGVSPQDIESAVTRKIEQQLSGMSGMKQIFSTSREGMSVVTVEFQPNVLIEHALQQVRDKVDLARSDLPAEADEPVITEINIAELPIMYLSIAGPISPVRLKAIAEQLEEAIEAVPGVLEAQVLGALEREIRIEVDPDRLAAYRIGLPELIRLVPNENVNVSAGSLESGATRFNVRVPAEFTGPGDVEHLLLTVRDGRPIYLSDIATIRDTFKDRQSISRLDGEPAITVAVRKRVGANIVEIARHVKAIVEVARTQVPQGVELAFTMDQSDDIHVMVADLENNILTSLVLVVLVLMLFLGLRTSLIVATVIPLSMLLSFAILQAMRITLNMIVLFSLILALGMLVDNAIVIVENIYRHVQLGLSRIQAARKGAAEVAWPVITSAATTIAAFAPLLFWEGIMGDFMKYLPITVITVLSSSLFVAMVINPVLSSVAISAGGRKKPQGHDNAPQRVYTRLLRTLLSDGWHRAATLVTIFALLVVVILIYARFNHGTRFFPDIDPKRGTISIQTPQGTIIDYTDQLARIVERRLAPYLASGEIEHFITNIGGGGDNPFARTSTGPHVANLTVVFPDFEDRLRSSSESIQEIRSLLTDLPGVELTVSAQEQGPPTGAAVTIRIAGEDFNTLVRLTEQARSMIVGTPNLVNLRSDFEAGRPELEFNVDRRRAMMLDVNTNVVGQFLKTAIFGQKVGTYRQFNDEYDITVRLPVENRENIQDLLGLHVPNAMGDPVPLSSLGEFRYAGGFGEIRRIDQKRVITLTGDVEGRQPPMVVEDVRRILLPTPEEQAADPDLTGLDMPPGYTLTFAGEQEEQEKAVAFLAWAFATAVLVILLILVTQFNTLGVPLVIMVTVMLSLIGVLIGLLVTGTPFVVIMTGIGVVSLAGVVVNNAIVLLDYTRQLQREGMSLIDAAVEAGRTRLRPVVLTAVTTMLSLVPMATGLSFDFHDFQFSTNSQSSEWWSSMANAVIFGLGFGTILTLVIVPTLYVSLYSLLGRLGLGGLKRPGEDLAETEAG